MLDRTTLVRATCVRLLHTAAFVAGLVAASNAMAHQYWLTAADLRPQRGDAVEIGARAGVGFAGEAKQATPSPGRERYRRCAKLWFAGTSDLIARRAIGLPLEIVPTTPPGDAAALRVRVLWNGRPLAGALLQTWRQPWTDAGRTRPLTERDTVAVMQKVKTDTRGEAVLDVRESGEWLVSVVHMVPSSVPAEADWESTWSSMTFGRPSRR